jgi:hypothetical protein
MTSLQRLCLTLLVAAAFGGFADMAIEYLGPPVFARFSHVERRVG